MAVANKIPTLPKSGGMIKKFQQQHYFKKKNSDVWTRIEKSTGNTITMNPQTQEFDYIVDENPTTEIDKYSPSMQHPITMYKGSPDFKLANDLAFNMATGADAHLDFLTIFFHTDGVMNGQKVFRAWRNDAVFSVSDISPTDSVINVDVQFAGTVEKGYVEMIDGQPVFTEGEPNSLVDDAIMSVPPLKEAWLGKPVSALIGEDVLVLSDGTVEGTLKKVENFRRFDEENEDNQSGWYLPIVLAQPGEKLTIKLNDVAVEGKENIAFSKEVVLRVTENTDVYTVEVDGKEVVSLSFAEATLEGKDALPEDDGKKDEKENDEDSKQEPPPAPPPAAEKVKVTFMHYGLLGNAEELHSVEVEKGKTLSDAIAEAGAAIQTPTTKNGGDFDHWSETEEGDDYGNDTAINAALTLYACEQ